MNKDIRGFIIFLFHKSHSFSRFLNNCTQLPKQVNGTSSNISRCYKNCVYCTLLCHEERRRKEIITFLDHFLLLFLLFNIFFILIPFFFGARQVPLNWVPSFHRDPIFQTYFYVLVSLFGNGWHGDSVVNLAVGTHVIFVTCAREMILLPLLLLFLSFQYIYIPCFYTVLFFAVLAVLAVLSSPTWLRSLSSIASLLRKFVVPHDVFL